MSARTSYIVAAMVITGMFLIVGGDAAGTKMTREGISPFFVAWSRFAVAALIILPFVGLKASELRWDWRLALRGALIVCGVFSILTALKTEDIANVFGAFFIGPIVAFVLSVVLLKEEASFAKAALLVVGFLGVILVVKPGFGMTIGLAYALIAGAFHGGYLVATRWLAGDYRPRFLLWSQLFVGAVALAPLGVTRIPTLDQATMILVLLSALGSALGNMLIVLANRRATATTIAPLIYSQLVHATVLGWLVFGTLPDGLSLIGLAIILLSGVASVWIARKA